VIATSVGGNVEAVVDGETGLLVPPNDPKVLAKAIKTLLDAPDERRKFGRAGRERVCRFFGMKRMTGAHERLYDDLVSRAAPKAAAIAVMSS